MYRTITVYKDKKVALCFFHSHVSGRAGSLILLMVKMELEWHPFLEISDNFPGLIGGSVIGNDKLCPIRIKFQVLKGEQKFFNFILAVKGVTGLYRLPQPLALFPHGEQQGPGNDGLQYSTHQRLADALWRSVFGRGRRVLFGI